MGKMEQVMRDEIRRLARREIRAAMDTLVSDVRELKRGLSRLTKRVDSIERTAREHDRKIVEETAKLEAAPDEVESSRMSPGLIRKLRKRFDLTQADLAALVDVSTPAVVFWENGRSRPKGENREALVALRKLGKREVQRLLEAKGRPVSRRRRRPKSDGGSAKNTGA